MYEGPLNGAKMTVMDILKFRDIDRWTLHTKIGTILSFLNRGAHCAPPGANRVKALCLYTRVLCFHYNDSHPTRDRPIVEF